MQLERKRVNDLASTCTLKGRMDEKKSVSVQAPD